MSRYTKYDDRAGIFLGQIITACYEISAKTKADAFFSYSPHTSQIDIIIHPNGWNSSNTEDDYFKIVVHNNSNHCIYFGDTEDSDDSYGISPLEEALKELTAFYEKLKGQVDEKDS